MNLSLKNWLLSLMLLAAAAISYEYNHTTIAMYFSCVAAMFTMRPKEIRGE